MAADRNNRRLESPVNYVIWIWNNSSNIRLSTIVRILVGTVRIAFALSMIWLCKRFIDVTVHTGTRNDILLMIMILIAVISGNVLCRQVYFYMGAKAEVLQTTTIRLRIFSHLFRRNMFSQKEMHSGNITSRLEKDIETVSGTTTRILTDFFVAFLQLICAFIFMQRMDTYLSLILLLLTPLFLVVGKLIARKMREMTKEIREQESDIQMLVQETMEHNAVLQSMESGDWITGQLDEMHQQLKTKVRQRARFTVVSRLIISFSFSFGYITAFIWGALQLRSGVITFGVMTSFLQLVSQIQQPILQMLNTLPQIIHTSASIDRLVELEKMESEDSLDDRNFMGNHVGLDVQHLSFKYAQGDRQIFSDFSHNFLPGSKTALLGYTGAGKTTLFRLILCLIHPDTGSLIVYNNEEKRLVNESTRSNFVFVPQGNTLMSGTIRYNLLLASPDADEEQLRQVLHIAMADFVFSLPEGMDTECGERGGGLSEGQAQRIAIARGLLRPGGILLLDEISASLDEQTEKELYRRLFEAFPDKTMIFITHRPMISKLCDQIINLSEN